jgi:hypothetical protein
LTYECNPEFEGLLCIISKTEKRPKIDFHHSFAPISFKMSTSVFYVLKNPMFDYYERLYKIGVRETSESVDKIVNNPDSYPEPSEIVFTSAEFPTDEMQHRIQSIAVSIKKTNRMSIRHAYVKGEKFVWSKGSLNEIKMSINFALADEVPDYYYIKNRKTVNVPEKLKQKLDFCDKVLTKYNYDSFSNLRYDHVNAFVQENKDEVQRIWNLSNLIKSEDYTKAVCRFIESIIVWDKTSL